MRNALAVVIVAALMGTWLVAQALRTADVELKAAQHTAEVEGDLASAIKQYQSIVERFKTDRAVVASALVAMAESYERLGDARSRALYERVVRDFADQRDAAAAARARLGSGNRDVTARGDRAVWTGPKVDLFGHVSPDERFISFTDWGGFSNLSVFDLTTKTDRPITANKGWFQEDPNLGEAQWSAVSPDGQQIAYAWFAPKVSEVRIVSVADRQPRTLLSFSDAAPGVRDWSPDGKLLAIGTERGDKTKQILVASVTDKSMRVLKTTGWRGPDQLFFSRDSRFLAFDLPASDDDNVQQRDVFILAVDGSREVRAVADAADDRIAGWSPDGKYLLFSSTRTGARSLWALPVSGGRPQGRPELVKTDIGASFSLGVGNSGALYLHKTVSSRDVKVARIDLDTGTLIGQPVHFSQGLLPAPMSPQWSPDGRFLAYQVRGDEEGAAIRSVETGEVRRMRNIQYMPDPRWSPDGRSLISGMEDSKGRSGIFRVDAQTGASSVIVYTDNIGTLPRWSADGTKIYYVIKRPFSVDERQIRERDLQTGTERDVFSHRWLGYFEVSPDGHSLAVQIRLDPASQTTSVMLVPLAEGEPRILARVSGAQSVLNARTMAWTPDSRALLTARKSGTVVELWLVDVESARGRKLDIDVREWALGEDGGPSGGFSLSPDGKSIAFLMGKSGAEVWALENFLSVLKN